MLEFELHQLGWFAFEQLSRTIAREVWRQPVETYSRGPDGGRDGTLFGPWIDGSSSSPCVLQCKHKSKSAARIALSDLRPELSNARRHVEAGRCDVYVLMTNAKLTGESAAKIERAFRGVGVRKFLILGYEAICELLTENKSLRALVPRLYGLGDLTEILDDRSYSQAEGILAMMHDQLARLVPVEAHRAAHRALRDHRFTLLIGRPGSGKSSIAASLAIGAMDIYASRPIKLLRMEELADRWNPRDTNQLFWLDDGFGATQYEYTSASSWNRSTSLVDAAIRKGARFIVTSRDYVFAAAKNDLKISAFPLLDEARVVIEVESFTTEEREQILFNHLRLGKQPRKVLASMSPSHLEAVASDVTFLPELARRLGDPFFTKHVRMRDKDSLLDFFRTPSRFLLEVLRSLDAASRAALGLVHIRGGRLPSPYQHVQGDTEFLDRLGVRISDVLAALPTLDGSLLRLVSVAGDRWWQYQHPTFKDAYQLWLAEHPELLAEYLASTGIADLVRTVTCGNVGLQGAVVVPSNLYTAVIARLQHQQPAVVKEEILPFLTRRCDDDFLRRYLETSPQVADQIFEIGLYVSSYTPQRQLARKLLDLGIAAEPQRKHLVETLTEYAVEGVDGSFLNDAQWLSFFTPDELVDLDELVVEELQALDDRISEDLSNLDGDTYPVAESLKGFEARYPSNPHVAAARQRLEHFQTDEPGADSDAWRENEPDHEVPIEHVARRASIFDDLAG